MFDFFIYICYNHKMTTLKKYTAFLLLPLILAGCGATDEIVEIAESLPVVTVQEIAAGGTQTFSVLGEVTAAQSADFTAEFRATVTAVLVRPGDTVRAGQQLLRLSSDSVSSSATTAGRSLTLAQQRLSETAAANEEAIASAKISLAQAETALSNRLTENELARKTAAESLQTAKNSIDGVIATTKTTITSSVNEADKILRVSSVYADEAYTDQIGVLDSDSLNTAERAVQGALVLRSLSSDDYQTVRAAAEQTESMLEAVLVTLNASATGGSLTQATLSGFISTINTHLASIRGNLTSLVSTSNGLVSAQSIASAEATYASTIASLDSAEDVARQAVDAAKTALRSVERQADLSVTGAESQLSAARDAASQSSINRNKLSITANFAGTVADIPVAVGDEVSPGSALVSVENSNTLKLIAYLTRSQADQVSVGDELQIGANSKDVISAKAAVIDPATRKIKVEILHENPYLAPGQFVSLAFTGRGSADGQILLPLSAVHVTSGGTFVWTVTGANLAERRSVVLGPIAGSDVVIVAGLAAGDRVIVAGGRKLKEDGIKVAIEGSSDEVAEMQSISVEEAPTK